MPGQYHDCIARHHLTDTSSSWGRITFGLYGVLRFQSYLVQREAWSSWSTTGRRPPGSPRLWAVISWTRRHRATPPFTKLSCTLDELPGLFDVRHGYSGIEQARVHVVNGQHVVDSSTSRLCPRYDSASVQIRKLGEPEKPGTGP